MANNRRSKLVVPPGYRIVFRPWFTDRNGRVRHASEFGVKAIPLLVRI